MRPRVLFSAILLSSTLALAQDIPLNNWTVPPYTRQSSGGITTMTDATPPRAFIGIQPCRVADTRGNAAPIQGGIFAAAETRTWTVTGICGIPSGADAISANFTVTGAPIAPPGSFILAWPTGGPVPPVSILNFQAGQTLANAAIVPLSANAGQINVNTSASVHIIMDVNGYFSDTLAMPLNGFALTNASNVDATLSVRNNSSNCSLATGCAINASSFTGTAIVGGAQEPGTLSLTYGVLGSTASQGTLSAGVKGEGYYKGVYGTGANVTNGSGVFGSLGVFVGVDSYTPHGVRGESSGGGVLGISPYEGVAGSLVNGSGHEIAYGVLGLTAGIGVDPGCPTSPCSGPWAVFGGGNIGATGAKYFLDPHPSDPNLAIAYISLEGPEAGTYFRGRGRFQNGTARIPVPEHFRLVTDPEGLTVQITPIGGMATVGVVRMDLNEIVVQASRNLEFSYLVQGVRATFKDKQPVRAVGDFMPRSPDAKMPDWLSPAQKSLLIRNGTYRADGTVNMETARRLGWDRVWEEQRSHPQPQPVQP